MRVTLFHPNEKLHKSLSPVDWVFASLRILTIAGGIGWLLFSPIAHGERQELFADLGLRVVFLFLLAISVGLGAEHERRHHEQIAHLNRDLIVRNRLIQQSYRLASIGRLAEGIAQEINNPAGVITGRAEHLIDTLLRCDQGSWRNDRGGQ